MSLLQVTPDCAGRLQRVRMIDLSDALPGTASVDERHELVDTAVRCPYCAEHLARVVGGTYGRMLRQEKGNIGVALIFPSTHTLLVCETCPDDPMLMFAVPVEQLEGATP